MAVEWHIRRASQQDHGAVSSLWQTTGLGGTEDAEWRAVIGGSCATLFVAVEGESVIGTALAAFDGWRAYIYHVAVLPSRQGEGLAKALMSYAGSHLEVLGARRIYVLVGEQNTAGLALSTAAGYEPEGDIALVKQLT
jgi:ribosomal protein S18 acetylase RimI-like enzyme